MFREKYKSANEQIKVSDTARILTLDKINSFYNTEQKKKPVFKYGVIATSALAVIAIAIVLNMPNTTGEVKLLVSEIPIETTAESTTVNTQIECAKDFAIAETTSPQAETTSAPAQTTAKATETTTAMAKATAPPETTTASAPVTTAENKVLNEQTIKNSSPFMAIASPVYPTELKLENYKDFNAYHQAAAEIEKNKKLDESFIKSLKDFSFQSASTILTDDTLTNQMYSPTSLYMAMAMLAEGANGDTQTEIVNALKMDSMSTINSQTGNLYRNFYFDNKIGRLKLANSVWLKNNINFYQSTLDNLAKNYYANSYSVEMPSDDTANQISKWISENTGGKLGTNPESFKQDTDTAMFLFNTIYFYDEWSDVISENSTKKEDFKLSDGSTVQSDFMRASSGYYDDNDKLTSTSLGFKNRSSMMFILPKDGVTVDEILSDKELLSNTIASNGKKEADVTLKLPKFKFKNKLDLIESLNKMGIKLAFNPLKANFSNFSSQPLWASGVIQEAFISIDEKGCEATAYTGIEMSAGEAEIVIRDKIEINLNKPFIFVIKNRDDIPLFIGIVNNPNK